MSDIRFNQWLHQSGTGGVSQSDGGHVGIGTTNPLLPVGAGNTNILHVGVVTSNSISAGSSITATTFYGSGANLTSLPSQVTIANNGNDRIITGGSGVNLNGEANLQFDGTDLYVSDKIKHLGDPDTLIEFATDTITFDTAGAERLRIASDGEILVPAAGANRISMRHTSGGNAVIKNPTAANLSFGTNNQDNELTIKNGGNVGINETSPDAPLHITGGLPHIRLENSGTSASAGDTFGQIDFKHNDSDDAGVTAAIKCVAEDNAGNSYLSFCNGDGGNANERLRIDSTGRVLIGGTSHPSGESIRTLNLISTSSTEAALVLSRSNSLGGSTTGQTIRLLTNGDLNFSVHNVGEKVRFPAAGGITFNGDSAAANALDDYEEGRYAPTPTGQTGTTSASFYGGDHYLSYTKIGNLVTIHGRIRLQNSNYNGGLRISLPFTADTSSDTDNSGGSSVGTHTVNFDNDAVGTGHNMGLLLETGSGSALGYFLINRDNSSWIAATAGNIKSGSYMLISHTYKST